MSLPRDLICICVLALFSCATIVAQNCEEKLLLKGDEHVVAHGVDSTGHWWAITQPFTQFSSLYVDGTAYGPFSEVQQPVFSADGTAWTAIARVNNVGTIVTASGLTSIPSAEVVTAFYASAAPVCWVVVRRDSTVTVSNGAQSYSVIGATGAFATDPFGQTLYYVGQRGASQCLVRNGVDGITAESVQLGGVWNDGRPVVAVRNGQLVSLMLGSTELLAHARTIQNIHVNRTGTVLAFECERSPGVWQAYCYSDDMNEPWFGPSCDMINDLTLHPTDAIVAYYGVRGVTRSVYYNAAEYPAGLETSNIIFSGDGAVMAYLSRDGDDYICLNGKRYRMSSKVSIGARLAIHPTLPLIAYATSASIVMWDVEQSAFKLGKMCDAVSDAVYDRRANAFRSTARQGERLYLLTCRP